MMLNFKIKKSLTENIPNNIHNSTIVKEMLAAIDASGILGGKSVEKA